MGYREIIPTERLDEFEKIGESEVQAKLDAGHYSGRHKDYANLFIKMCDLEREPDEQTSEADKQTPEPVIPWHEKSWGKVIIGVLIGVLIVLVASWLGLS